MPSSNHASNAARHARRGAKQLRRQAEEARNGVMDTVHKMGHEAVGALRDNYDDLHETASDYVRQGRKQIGNFERSIEKRVKQNPMTTIFTCLGLGFLVGFLYTRR